jgi:triacylglycerol lipase
VSRISIPDYVIVAFRGTQSRTEWIYDVDILSVPLPVELGGDKYPKARVHQGFLQLYMGLRSNVLEGVKAYGPKGIIITGHSLGSSLATLAAFDLAFNGFNVHSTYTWASPRVGDPYFVEAFENVLKESPHYRIANAADFVTQVPPAALSVPKVISKYMHVSGVECSYEYVDESVIDYPSSQFTSWAHDLNTYFQFGQKFLPFRDFAQQ